MGRSPTVPTDPFIPVTRPAYTSFSIRCRRRPPGRRSGGPDGEGVVWGRLLRERRSVAARGGAELVHRVAGKGGVGALRLAGLRRDVAVHKEKVGDARVT